MPSIHDIVDGINKAATCLPEDSELKNIAITVYRDDVEKLPCVVSFEGEGEYVGIDDRFAVLWYHKLNRITVIRDPKKEYGRGPGDVSNSYDMSMIVFLNRNRARMRAADLINIIEEFFPYDIKLEPFKSIRIVLNNIILNDQQVYNQEYESRTNRLQPEHNLFQINYTVEASFTKGCFNNCT
jgi:hypothetical protein